MRPVTCEQIQAWADPAEAAITCRTCRHPDVAGPGSVVPVRLDAATIREGI
ncbi:hypothetical protein [Acidipropionibacterium jensenii]|uniref:hypothetical protein n=1 Tax=Acidipropionibacterium jensenii TaxID=1749 RepID=UPI00214B44F4|nr:hypothetical protein [Acidipropionibacterium jensenii]